MKKEKQEFSVVGALTLLAMIVLFWVIPGLSHHADKVVPPTLTIEQQEVVDMAISIAVLESQSSIEREFRLFEYRDEEMEISYRVISQDYKALFIFSLEPRKIVASVSVRHTSQDVYFDAESFAQIEDHLIKVYNSFYE